MPARPIAASADPASRGERRVGEVEAVALDEARLLRAEGYGGSQRHTVPATARMRRAARTRKRPPADEHPGHRLRVERRPAGKDDDRDASKTAERYDNLRDDEPPRILRDRRPPCRTERAGGGAGPRRPRECGAARARLGARCFAARRQSCSRTSSPSAAHATGRARGAAQSARGRRRRRAFRPHHPRRPPAPLPTSRPPAARSPSMRCSIVTSPSSPTRKQS